MAKRKRLTPMPSGPLTTLAAQPVTRAPIADVAREAARSGAFEEMAATLAEARAEGRLVQRLPIDAIDAQHLIRDRLKAEYEAMDELCESLRARGQQMPIEVTDLGGGRYGLISGWRRLMALHMLVEKTEEARFTTVLAFVRAPESLADAYRAMVEENEIRADLSLYERARIVLRAVEAGVFEDRRTALRQLFAAASYSRRSKIGTFMPVVAALDGDLRHPSRLTERLGLALARAMEEDATLPARLRERLGQIDPSDPAAEADAISAVIAPPRAKPRTKSPPIRTTAPAPMLEALPDGRDVMPITAGLSVRLRPGEIRLTGPDATPELADHIVRWLQGMVEGDH